MLQLKHHKRRRLLARARSLIKTNMFGAKHRRNATELAAATLMVLVNMPLPAPSCTHIHTKPKFAPLKL